MYVYINIVNKLLSDFYNFGVTIKNSNEYNNIKQALDFITKIKKVVSHNCGAMNFFIECTK